MMKLLLSYTVIIIIIFILSIRITINFIVIIIIITIIIIIMSQCKTLEYCPHYRAYNVTYTTREAILRSRKSSVRNLIQS